MTTIVARTAAVLLLGMATAAAAMADDGKIDPRTGAPAEWGLPMMGGQPLGMALVDRVESGWGDNEDRYVWDAQAWYGTDWNKLWVKTEGEGEQGQSPEDAELQLLYARLFSPFFVWQAGLRHDFEPQAERDFFVVGVQGLVPYMFELDSALFVSEEGDVSARVEAEHEWLFTQRLVLQPRFELNAAFSDVPEVGLGSGVNNTELGLRLRYEIRRKFAPYIGVSWTKFYGETADIRTAAGGDDSNVSAVIGIRAWF